MPVSSNLEEYDHPELYDLENKDFEPEGLLYLALAKELGGAVLELGCGTGRMTIPLAQHGIDITGLDIVPGMLAAARAKAGDLPIQWAEADVRTFQLDRKFNFIFEAGSVFRHMLTNDDQLAYLARAREHLAPGGCLFVSLLFPHPANLSSDPQEKEWFSYQDRNGNSVRVSGMDHYDELRQVMTETAIRRISLPDGSETVYTAPLQQRFTFPQEMEALLERAGFEVKARYGGPDRSPLTSDSQFLVYLCQSR